MIRPSGSGISRFSRRNRTVAAAALIAAAGRPTITRAVISRGGGALEDVSRLAAAWCRRDLGEGA